jgi:hypothetical protein
MFSIQTGADRFCYEETYMAQPANRCVMVRGGGSRRYDALAFHFAAH